MHLRSACIPSLKPLTDTPETPFIQGRCKSYPFVLRKLSFCVTKAILLQCDLIAIAKRAVSPPHSSLTTSLCSLGQLTR